MSLVENEIYNYTANTRNMYIIVLVTKTKHKYVSSLFQDNASNAFISFPRILLLEYGDSMDVLSPYISNRIRGKADAFKYIFLSYEG